MNINEIDMHFHDKTHVRTSSLKDVPCSVMAVTSPRLDVGLVGLVAIVKTTSGKQDLSNVIKMH